MKKIDILGIQVDDCSLQELLSAIVTYCKNKEKKKVMYANIHVINNALTNESLKEALNRSDIVYCDGDGVRLGARLLKEEISERMTGADWIDDLCQRIREEGYSLYLLGGKPGVAKRAKEVLSQRYKNIHIVGENHGYFDLEGTESDEVIRKINSKNPDILLVGFGTPFQECWISKNRDLLEPPVVWAVGALVDFVSGEVKRAPDFFLNNNLEWLYRLYHEPVRMWRRYILGNGIFVIRIIIQKMKI